MRRLTLRQLRDLREEARRESYPINRELAGRVIVHMGTCGVAAGAKAVAAAFSQELERNDERNIFLTTTGCAGFCSREPMATVELRDTPRVLYGGLSAEAAERIAVDHLRGGRVVEEYAVGVGPDTEIPFFRKQKFVVLKNRALLDPEQIDAYLAKDGYTALERALTAMTPEEVVEEIRAAGLRGRGGAGFPTGKKWRICRSQKGTPKYVIGNCDEGDPGAYMDRSLLESDPHSVLEGMIVAAYAIGAAKGYFYIRTEYPLAIERMHRAIEQALEYGLVGSRIMGTDFDFGVEIREGSGAFVCGEETSLIHSIEGRNPEPSQRPPYPAQAGLWGRPTVINNVETLANVTAILEQPGDWYTQTGTPTSKGTKVFSLVGKIRNSGLIEVPMGTSLREIVYEVGGGIPDNKRFKAVQTGGPSGGCLSAELIDLPIDYESLTEVGSMMGSGGMIVMDEDTCMVDLAKFFVEFTNDESCGKCSACREGSAALLEVLSRITRGDGREGDLEFLEELSLAVKDASMCGLGATLPNPVLSTLRYFRDEYTAHVHRKECPAVVCKGLISSPCQYVCPLGTDVPAYLTLIARGQFEEALEVVRMTNPLPIICGRVCLAHCEMRCRARENGGALAVRELKRFLTDYELATDRVHREPTPERKFEERIAIVGSGPAGLTAGYYLAQKGYGVTIFEKLPVAGGMLAVGIPEYRLPKELLRIEVEAIERAGVEIRTDCKVENVDSLRNDGYSAVLITVGSHKDRSLGVPGEDARGVIDAIGFLRRVNLGEPPDSLGEHVGIIGGGNTAIDVARTALRLAPRKVTILYRRTRAEMPAIPGEIEAAFEEGVDIEYLVTPTRIITERGKIKALELVRTRLGDPDASGRRRPVPIEGSEFAFELTSLIPAISQDPDLSLLPEGSAVRVSDWGTIVADEETFATDQLGVFACGDAVRGPADVAVVMADARIAAGSIHQYLRGEEIHREYQPLRPHVHVEPLKLATETAEDLVRAETPRIPLEDRRFGFKEAELGFSKETAMREASRCLRCDWEAQRPRQKDKLETATER
jgi:NADH-quinone oxidoreductase subunit F